MTTISRRPTSAGWPGGSGLSSGRRSLTMPWPARHTSVASMSVKSWTSSVVASPLSVTSLVTRPAVRRRRANPSKSTRADSRCAVAAAISSTSRLAAVLRAISLRMWVSRCASCSRAKRRALVIAMAAAWQTVAAVSISSSVNSRGPRVSTSSTMPTTTSPAISGNVTQHPSSVPLPRMSSRTWSLTRGSSSEVTVTGRFVRMTSWVTVVSSSGRRTPSSPCRRPPG